YIDPNDAIAGRTVIFMSNTRTCSWNPAYSYAFLEEDHKKYGIQPGIGADAHFAADYRIGLALGYNGILEKIRRYRDYYGEEKREFYDAEESVVLGIKEWIKRNADQALEASKIDSDPIIKSRLEEVWRVCSWVMENPPRTLHEACQWIAFFNSASRSYNRDGAGCQLDEILRPYYEADIASGSIDDEDAIFLLACLLLNDPHYYQLGGPDQDGRDLISHISFLILEAASRLGSTVNLTVRVHDGLDKEFFRQAVKRLFIHRKGWPRFAGDKALSEGFARNGYPIELGRRRIATGCNWMAIPGIEYCMNDTIKISFAKVLEVAWNEMASSGDMSLDNLWKLFSLHVERAVLCVAKGIDFHLAHQWENEPELVMNLLCYGPLEKGLDASAGGLELYDIGVDGTGLATVADSFAALEQRVLLEGFFSWEEVNQMLQADFSGFEKERLLLSSSERYGQGGLGDKWAIKVSRVFTEAVKRSSTPNGVNMIPGWFSWSQTISIGKLIGATPNGRKAGEPISHGANPHSGIKGASPTQISSSIASIQPGYGNSAPFQLELDPKTADGEGGTDKICGLIRTHFRLGGTLVNINILNAETLKKAMDAPELYPDLIVRVTGFTAYFAALSPEFRKLVADRLIEG
ncbi:MAG: pyruvate formate lyase family protein, partial [Clostridiales bacterium]|nr:pyruvate formate lyase family protein [Clostridiales bacterium]